MPLICSHTFTINTKRKYGKRGQPTLTQFNCIFSHETKNMNNGVLSSLNRLLFAYRNREKGDWNLILKLKRSHNLLISLAIILNQLPIIVAATKSDLKSQRITDIIYSFGTKLNDAKLFYCDKEQTNCWNSRNGPDLQRNRLWNVKYNLRFEPASRWLQST